MADDAVAEMAGRPPSGTRWSRTFEGTPQQVSEARRFLAGVLGDSPANGDVLVCLSEIMTNAVVHSRSAWPGGTCTVRAEIGPGGRLRVEVDDDGGPWLPRLGNDELHGRGLALVGALADRWGVTGPGVSDLSVAGRADGGSGAGRARRTVWFEVKCPDEQFSA